MSPAPAPREWFTARELVELVSARGMTGFPTTERGMLKFFRRFGPLPDRFCRKRPGRGGATEYHFSILPERLQAALAADAARASAATALETTALADRRRIDAIRMTALAARPRSVMEARAAILTAIDGHAAAQGEARSWAIARFLEAQDEARARQASEGRRDRGHVLTAREAEDLAHPLALKTWFHIRPEVLAQANDRRRGAVSRATLYGWFKARAESGVVALAPVPPREAQPIPAGFSDFLRHYARPTKPTVADAHAEYLRAAQAAEGAQAMTLSLDQVRRILRDRLNSIERNVGREGLLTLRSRLPYVARTTDGMLPTTIYSADGKTFDAEVADPVTKLPIRPEITTVIDVVTRKFVGTSFGRAENQRSVAEALRNACVAHGIPAIFYVDRGPGYRNEALDADVAGLMGRLGITKMHAAPYGSQAKGRIERPNATVWDRLARRFPTYIGADMDKEAGQNIHKTTRREIREFGQSRHLPPWEEFVAKALEMVADYNASPHRGLPKFEDPVTGRTRHMSPDEAWAAHVAAGFEPVPVDADEADDLFRPYEFRVVRRGLVQWNNNHYFDEALEAFHEQRVMVGYDYARADKVWVREFDMDSGQPGRLICVARFNAHAERYVPVSFEEQAQEKRTNAALKRIDRKRAAIEAERDAARSIEARPVMPATFIAPEPDVIEEVPAVAALPRRRVFASDEELAAWALQHPAEVTANQIAVLRDCLSRPAARELFRMSGIDVEALRTLLRAVA